MPIMNAPVLARRILPSTWTRADLALVADAVAQHGPGGLWWRVNHAWQAWGNEQLLLTTREWFQLLDSLALATHGHSRADAGHAARLLGWVL